MAKTHIAFGKVSQKYVGEFGNMSYLFFRVFAIKRDFTIPKR